MNRFSVLFAIVIFILDDFTTSANRKPAKRGQFKYVAVLRDLLDANWKPFCGASIIHARFALTVGYA